MLTTTKAKNMGWLVKHFGEDGARTIELSHRYGFIATVSNTPERSGYLFGILKYEYPDKQVRLGVFDTSAEAVDFLKLLIASSRMNDETVDQSN